MKLITENQELQEELISCFETFDSCQIAVAWATTGEHSNALYNNREKITNLFVGLFGNDGEKTTSIEFVKMFKGLSNVHFVRSNNPNSPLILHSKHYFFQSSKTKWCCYIGSANLTKRGSQNIGNFETMIKVSSEDANSDQFYNDNIHFFNELSSCHEIHICNLDELNQYCAS